MIAYPRSDHRRRLEERLRLRVFRLRGLLRRVDGAGLGLRLLRRVVTGLLRRREMIGGSVVGVLLRRVDGALLRRVDGARVGAVRRRVLGESVGGGAGAVPDGHTPEYEPTQISLIHIFISPGPKT